VPRNWKEREKKLSKRKSRMKKHGKNIAIIYRNVIKNKVKEQ